MSIVTGIDVSNYTAPLTPEQLAWVEANCAFVIIGLQDAGRARDFQRQFANLRREYYIERPNRDLTIPERGSRVWIDVEPGCITTRQEIIDTMAEISVIDRSYGIYGNQPSIQPVIGDSTEFADLPYWWANYGTPDMSRFKPHNGWTAPTIMQYSSDGVQGINCDLNIMVVEVQQEGDVPENYPGDANERRARELLAWALYNGKVKVAFTPDGQHIQVAGVEALEVPAWAKPS